ncbi:hypothetical protein HU985_18545 [Photobacterium damselae subsp. damselae]|uniref:hypothetical protein n=1 Tax=Photobacterium damselae TaxID=38293 RepID=UPI001592D192|nr:hypothetical protein [Photobacterium damselae]NVH52898.1 hypothetical protein [Photobacterium damselae subsp. damselae]NVO80918.1 hypothetical protein [Photobacterium damselae subsp. damselae]
MSTTKSNFIKLPTGDAFAKSLIGSCSHYRDHGLMLLNSSGEKLLWVPEPDNAKAAAMRDEIVAELMA